MKQTRTLPGSSGDRHPPLAIRVSRDDEAHLLDHPVVGLGGLALGREIVADEDRVGGIQAQRLQAAQVQLAAAGDAQLAASG